MRIAIIGGIGSGKSEVLNIARERGLACVSADEINAKLLTEPDYIKKIGDAFDGVVVEGVIDRKKLASIVFADNEKRNVLNSIAHPEIMKRIGECTQNPLVVELPLFVEGGDKDFDEVILVCAPFDVRVERLVARGLEKEDAIARINAQVSANILQKFATKVIENDGTIEQLNQKVNAIFDLILSKQHA